MSLASVTSSAATEWFLDSGATSHLTANCDWIKDFVTKPDDEVGTANSVKLASTGVNSVDNWLYNGCA